MIDQNDNITIIGLNCRSISNKLGEIKLLIYTQKPEIVAFTETWLANNTKYLPKFIGYTCEFINRVGFAGGIGLLIKDGVQYQNINLGHYQNGHLECQAVNVILKKGGKIGILNVYNPGKPVMKNEFKHYISQIGNKYVVIGDFNIHSKLLETKCIRSNFSGKSLEMLIAEEDVCLVNPRDMYTYVSPATGKRSCLDLCLASSNIAAHVNIGTLWDVGSDHVPIKVVATRTNTNDKNIRLAKKWKINAENIGGLHKVSHRVMLV